jgi:hypothetical protein
MCQLPQPTTNSRKITRPHSKLNRLCAEAKVRGGTLTTFAKVATALDVTPGRVTQMFGYSRETEGTVVNAETVGGIVAAFVRDGVQCIVDWFYLDFPEFAEHLAGLSTARSTLTTLAGTASARWELSETSVLPDLVELRLHAPRPANEVPDSTYVGVTLLFGTAHCDYDPEDGDDPRTVSIALCNARATIGAGGFQPLQGSMIGERVISDDFRRVAGGIEITGPTRNGVLDGDPFGDDYLAVIAPMNGDGDPFTVTIAANRRSFVVLDADAPRESHGSNAPTGNKNAILNVLIYKNVRKDDTGRAILARATMKHAPGTSDKEP